MNDTGYGGGVFAYHMGNFERNNVEGNIASQNGDGTGGGIYVIYLHTAAQNTIVDNEATRGGAYITTPIRVRKISLTTMLSRKQRHRNSDATQDGGGGITSAANRLSIYANTIISNTANGAVVYRSWTVPCMIYRIIISSSIPASAAEGYW